MTESAKENSGKVLYNPFDNDADSGSCGCSCGCSTSSGSQNTGNENTAPAIPVKVTIDGQEIEVVAGDKNIVDVASRAKIAIPAACYRTGRSRGCCHGCVVEINGEQKFACATPPEKGMNIVVDRDDLKAIRKKNLAAYKEGIESGNPCKCSVPGSGDC